MYDHIIIIISFVYACSYIKLSCDCSLSVVTRLCFSSSVVPRLTSASSECLSREREACCNYWEITLRPNTSSAAPSFLRTHSHTRSKHSTPSRNNSNTLFRTNTKSIQAGSRLQHLLRPRPILQILSQPENWQEPVGALCSIQPNRSHEQRHEAPHLRDP